jgi:RimJ/RimL family protein N-acetyltransferase
MRSREDVVRWLYWDAPTEERTRAWLEGILARPPETGTTLAVELRDSGVLVGHVNVMVDPDNRQGEIGFIFDPGHQGRGYATEAARALVPTRSSTTACTASTGGSSRATSPPRGCSRSSACAARPT